MTDKGGILTDTTHGYKIERLDGLFSTGGAHPQWSTRGKMWPTRAGLSSHLRILKKYGTEYPVGTKVIKYEIEWRNVHTYPVEEHDPLIEHHHKAKCLRAMEVIKSNYPDCRYTMLREAIDLALDLLEKEAGHEGE